MDDHTKKRPAGGLELSKRSSGLPLKETKHARNFHECNATGCSTGHNSMKNTQNNCSGKLKYLKHPLCFRSSNPNSASSSRSLSSSINLNCHGILNEESLKEANVAECTNKQAEKDDGFMFDLEFHGRKKENEYSGGLKQPAIHSFPSSSTKMPSNSKATFASRYGKQVCQSSKSAIQDNANPPFCHSSIPRIASQIPTFTPQCVIDRPLGYGLKIVGAASISDALSFVSSSAGHDKRAVLLRKNSQDGEGSSVLQVPDGTSGTKCQYNSRDATISLRTRLSSGAETSSMRLNEQEDEHIFELPGTITFPTQLHSPLIISEVVQERPFDFQNTSFVGRPRSHGRSSRSVSFLRSEDVDDFLGLDMEGIGEVLQALERIEQDEELTYEQLLVLEANILEGFSFYDQHRDMRLDVDNMSYEVCFHQIVAF
ncbi:uncharacterized protein LOC110037904 [Phalaenopsis equestris]|uniref:uncharacterized protein LOC110037904 n=1 Tax=Phalaenopsis equestris TaxID=78828 RepID=UPI0009E1B82E|nr:uncharacterized protein LOC110037904 [Phalaenopsis equestris]